MRVLPAILTLLAVFPGWALAQSSGERIKALDKIRMTCLEESALNKTYKVTKDGVILVDFLGAVEIGGLTEEEAGKLISNKLVNDRILRDATVSVVRVNSEGTGSTTTPPALSVKLSGAFREQKSIPHQEGLKLSTVVQTADATADLTKVKVKSFDGLIVTYDCTKPETDVSLKAGDEVILNSNVPRVLLDVYVFGAVAKPGLVQLSEDLTVRKAIEAAGGTVSDEAKKRVRLERSGSPVQTIDLNNPGDVALLPNDRIVVDAPETRAYVQVGGDVKTPGYFVLSPGMKLRDAVNSAGGYGPKAKIDKVKIVSSGASKPRIVNFKEIEQGYAGDVVLKPGDQVIVPGAGKKNDLPMKLGLGFAAYWFLFRR